MCERMAVWLAEATAEAARLLLIVAASGMATFTVGTMIGLGP
jgi:hypothetical protein